jgi:uncharacterized membrane protein
MLAGTLGRFVGLGMTGRASPSRRPDQLQETLVAKPDSKSSRDNSTAQKALIAGGVAAAAGAAAFLLARKGNPPDDGAIISDVPAWTLAKARQGAQPIAARTLLIGRPRGELYAAFKQFRRFPDFMENVAAVEGSEQEARWTIKAPAGRTVTLVTRLREDIPDRKIAWESLPASDIATKGQVEFEDAPCERGTFVSLVMSYDPPGGKVGQLAAKLFAREPNIQARHDLRRFKQLMETGEVTKNASPSARRHESPTEPRV